MLTEEIVNRYKHACKELEATEKPIHNEIERVFKAIATAFYGKFEYFYFPGAAEGEVGDMSDIEFDNDPSCNISVEVIHSHTGKMGKWMHPLPCMFLYMEDEAIIKHLRDTEDDIRKKKEEADQRRKKERLDKKKEERNKRGIAYREIAAKQGLIKNIKEKLTPQEIEVLGI